MLKCDNLTKTWRVNGLLRKSTIDFVFSSPKPPNFAPFYGNLPRCRYVAVHRVEVVQMSHDSPFGLFAKLYDSQKETEMSLEDYLKCCARDPLAYASAAERMLAAIGEPEMIDTSHDQRFGRIFMNRTIRVYPAFAEFFGMEETI